MKIEILNEQGEVIAYIAETTEPDRDQTAYRGASWREYLPSEDELTDAVRNIKLGQINAEARTRVAAVNPDAGAFAELIGVLATWLTATGPGADDWNRLKAIAAHGKGKRAWAQTASRAELEAYDPAADPGWNV